MSDFIHSSHLIRVEKMKTDQVILFSPIVAFLRDICARSRKVTLKIAAPKEVNIPIGQKNCGLCLFEYRKMDSFLKVFRNQLFSKVLYIWHVTMFYIEI